MKYLKNKKDCLNYVVTSYVLLNVLYVFISSFLVTQNIIYYSHYGKSMIGVLMLNVVFIIIMFIVRKNKHIKFKFQIYDLLIILMSIFAIISCFFAISKYAALYGFYLRYEGVFAILYYFSIFYISTFVKKEHKKIIAILIVVFGVINSIYAYLQIHNYSFAKCFYKNYLPVASGFNSNPNFFSSSILLSICFAIGLFFDTNDKLYKTLYSMFIIILMYGLVIGDTRSCIVGLCVVMIYIFIYSLRKRKFVDLGIIVGLLLIVFLYMHFTKKTTLVHFLNNSMKEAVSLIEGADGYTFGAKRIGVWKESLKIAPKYFLHGVGIDNFFYVLNGMPIRVGSYSFDKAHNEYIQILITEGFFALISYLSLIFTTLYFGIKNSFKDNQLYLVLPVIGYLVQAFFNISVIDVAPIFYISLGMLIFRK